MMSRILRDVADGMLLASASNILDDITNYGFDNRQQVEEVLGYYSYDLLYTVLRIWPEDAPFAVWLCDLVMTSWRKSRLDVEQIFTQLNEKAVLRNGTDLAKAASVHKMAGSEASLKRQKPCRKSAKAPALRRFPRRTRKTTPRQKKAAITAAVKIRGRPEKPSLSSRNKRRTCSSAVSAVGNDDGYTSTDSFSGDKLENNDYRVRQVKTRSLATNTSVTQYWYWRGRTESFQLLLLSSVKPTVWRPLAKENDIRLRAADISKVSFAAKNTKVKITRKGYSDLSGDVLTEFKRKRTMTRFLTFLENRGVTVAEVAK